ncbi:hypothetical protein ACFXO9_37320 [Nocardia tengchongensis]|uniref:hypothetical protein n=1 Tax=Nocardia tengchongensis TaxID=2055889 RepID=UPI0036902F0D
MAVAVIVELDDTTVAQYDSILEILGFTPGGPMASGGLFHWVTATDAGVRVTDVWNSADDFQRFANEQLAPALQKAGVGNEPRISFEAVHNFLTAG